MDKKRPVLAYSEMTGRVYLITKYCGVIGTGKIEAKEKFDVTDDFDRIAIIRKRVEGGA